MEERDNTADGRKNKPVVSEGDSSAKVKKLTPEEKIKKILTEADERSGKQRSLFAETELVSGEKAQILEPFKLTRADLQNPDLAWELYYGKYRALIRKYVPKGKDGAPIRQELNLFLKEGQNRKRDGRQAFTKVIQAAVNYIVEWVNAEGHLMELWEKFRDLNLKNKKLIDGKDVSKKATTKPSKSKTKKK